MKIKKDLSVIIFTFCSIFALYIFSNFNNHSYKTKEISNEGKIENNYVINSTTEIVESSSSDLCPIDIDLSKVYSYDYTGGEQTFIAPIAGYYKLEIWGAQGGASTGSGGYGGYSTGEVYLSENEVLYIYIGGKGATNSAGYNGGGSASYSAGGGGGATHIATKLGLLSTLSSSVSSVLIVSGGGGGSASYGSYSGGSAGGYAGLSGLGNAGKGGSQTSGGSGAKTGTGSTSTAGGDGQFGAGGSGGTESQFSNASGGGGAGFYGGGGGFARDGGGGGGSGYIGNSLLTNKVMYCYNCTASSETSTKTVSTTCVSSTATSNCAKQGNGYAKISYVSI